MRHIQTLKVDFTQSKTPPSLELRQIDIPITVRSWLTEREDEAQYFYKQISEGISIALPSNTREATVELHVGERCFGLHRGKNSFDQLLWKQSTQALSFSVSTSRNHLLKGSDLLIGITQNTSTELLTTFNLSLSALRQQLGIRKVDNQTTEVEEFEIPLEGYHCIFEAYQLDELRLRSRLGFIPTSFIADSPILEFSARLDPNFMLPGGPKFEDLLPKVPIISLNFGPERQTVLTTPISSYADKVNISNLNVPTNHRYWQAAHHQQGFAWSPGTLTLKTTATFMSQSDALLEIIAAKDLPAIHPSSKRALTFSFFSGC